MFLSSTSFALFLPPLSFVTGQNLDLFILFSFFSFSEVMSSLLTVVPFYLSLQYSSTIFIVVEYDFYDAYSVSMRMPGDCPLLFIYVKHSQELRSSSSLSVSQALARVGSRRNPDCFRW